MAAGMITDEQKRIASRDIATTEATILAIGRQITILEHKRQDHHRSLAELKLIRDGIEPCRACRRKVASPCHDRPSLMEHGVWELALPRRALSGERRMSTPQRRRELAAERDAQAERDEIERNRVAHLGWYQRIEECDSIHDIKEVLHEITDQLDRESGFERNPL